MIEHEPALADGRDDVAGVMGHGELVVDLADAVLADQRLGQPVGVMDIIESEPSLDAEPLVSVGEKVFATNTALARLPGLD